MSRKVWVKTHKSSPYDRPESKWELGTVVGEQSTERFKEHPTMNDMLQGNTFWKEIRLLVELESGEVVEAWITETYDPTEVKKK